MTIYLVSAWLESEDGPIDYYVEAATETSAILKVEELLLDREVFEGCESRGVVGGSLVDKLKVAEGVYY